MSQYASISDLHSFGAPPSAFGSLVDADKNAALAAASGELDAAASSQGAVPLVSVPGDIVQKVCAIAAYELLSRVGFNPTGGADQNYLLRCNAARDYFKQIARGEVRPLFTFATPRETYAQPSVSSRPKRGW